MPQKGVLVALAAQGYNKMLRVIELCVKHNEMPVRKVYAQDCKVSSNSIENETPGSIFGVEWFCPKCSVPVGVRLYDTWAEAIEGEKKNDSMAERGK